MGRHGVLLCASFVMAIRRNWFVEITQHDFGVITPTICQLSTSDDFAKISSHFDVGTIKFGRALVTVPRVIV